VKRSGYLWVKLIECFGIDAKIHPTPQIHNCRHLRAHRSSKWYTKKQICLQGLDRYLQPRASPTKGLWIGIQASSSLSARISCSLSMQCCGLLSPRNVPGKRSAVCCVYTIVTICCDPIVLRIQQLRNVSNICALSKFRYPYSI
jgi:hypothetical protein